MYSFPSLQVTEKDCSRAGMPSSSAMTERLPSNTEASTSNSAAYIEHTVTRLDTLAGVAIKYGVEVADVKRFNGLTTDLQMFALKTLRIPTPGRHPLSAVLSNPSQSRCDDFAPSVRPYRAGSCDVNLPGSGMLKPWEKTQDTPTMDLLRSYYGLPSSSGRVGEGLEMTTLYSDRAIDLDDEVFLPMFRPPHIADSQKHCSGDYRTNRCGYVRESCNNLLDSCWSAKASGSTESSHLMKSSKRIVTEGDSQSKERPIRRRARSELGTDDTHDVGERVNFPRRDPASRPKDLNPIEGPFGSSSMKTFGAALLGGKEAVEGLLSKVKLTATPTSAQETGRPLCERVPSTGSFSILEGITSAYRQAKAALD